VIVAHVEVIAIVIEGNARFDVVRRIDVELALEDMRRRVRGVDVRHQRLRDGLRRDLLVINA
jgi:hypothetical protein